MAVEDDLREALEKLKAEHGKEIEIDIDEIVSKLESAYILAEQGLPTTGWLIGEIKDKIYIEDIVFEHEGEKIEDLLAKGFEVVDEVSVEVPPYAQEEKILGGWPQPATTPGELDKQIHMLFPQEWFFIEPTSPPVKIKDERDKEWPIEIFYDTNMIPDLCARQGVCEQCRDQKLIRWVVEEKKYLCYECEKGNPFTPYPGTTVNIPAFVIWEALREGYTIQTDIGLKQYPRLYNTFETFINELKEIEKKDCRIRIVGNVISSQFRNYVNLQNQIRDVATLTFIERTASHPADRICFAQMINCVNILGWRGMFIRFVTHDKKYIQTTGEKGKNPPFYLYLQNNVIEVAIR